MGGNNKYRNLMENNFAVDNDEELSKRILHGSIMEAVENQLKEGNPPFVTEIFFSLQRKGYNRREARTVIASVLIEEMYYVLRDKREYDEKKYESALKKRNRTILNTVSIPYATYDIDEEINDSCRKIWDAISDDDEEEAAVLFLEIWPTLKEYVVHNLYRDTHSGVEKPDIADISKATEYEMDFESLILEMGMILHNTHRYQQAIEFAKEVLELFSWERTEPDSFKDDIGQALADMGKMEESDAWYEKWLKEEPDNGNCVNGYAFCHQFRGDLEGALKIVEAHMPTGEPVNFKYHNLYLRAAELYKEIGDVEKEKHYNRLLEESESGTIGDLWDYPEEEYVSKPVVKEKKIYPNDPCPCGSGKNTKNAAVKIRRGDLSE